MKPTKNRGGEAPRENPAAGAPVTPDAIGARRDLIRKLLHAAHSAPSEKLPVAAIYVGLLLDGRVTTNVVGVEPEQCGPLVDVLEELVERLREHERENSLRAGPLAEVLRLRLPKT